MMGCNRITVEALRPVLAVFALLARICIPGFMLTQAAAAQTAGLSEAEIDARLTFIESRLDAGRRDAALWQNGWRAAYAGVAAVQGTLAFTENKKDDQVANGVGALRAVTAFTLLTLRPHPGSKGADPVRVLTGETRMVRLAAAELLLKRSARRAEERYSPRRHLINIGMNLAFGGMICAFGDCADAPLSVLIGIAGGEAALWTIPTQAVADLQAYRRRFGGQTETRISWQMLPAPGGIQLRGRF